MEKGKAKMAKIQCHGCGKWGHYVRDCPDRAIKAVEIANWGQSFNPNYVTFIVTDSCFKGYGKTSWFSVNNINPQKVNQTVTVPKPDASWERVKKSTHAASSKSKVRFMSECAESCGCESNSPWQGLADTDDDFPTVEEAASIPSERAKASMPKITRKSKQGSSNHKKNKSTCDADSMKIGRTNKILASFKSDEPTPRHSSM